MESRASLLLTNAALALPVLSLILINTAAYIVGSPFPMDSVNTSPCSSEVVAIPLLCVKQVGECHPVGSFLQEVNSD